VQIRILVVVVVEVSLVVQAEAKFDLLVEEKSSLLLSLPKTKRFMRIVSGA